MAAKVGVSSFDQLSDGGKAGLLVLMLAILGALYYFVLHMGLSDELTQEETRFQTLTKELGDAEARQQEYLRLRKQIGERTALDRYHLRILDLNRLAELSGLDIKLVEPKNEENEADFVRIPVSLMLQGRFHHVMKFFYNASLVERAINMENIKLIDPKPRGDEIRLTVEVLATTFRRPDQTTQPSVGAKTKTPAPAPAAGGRK